MLKHFSIWPSYIDKNNLFEEQKIFLIYLIGVIPGKDDWTIEVSYQKELHEIKKIKNIELDKTEIDLAKLQGRNINEIRAEKLLQEKQQQFQELNKKYGIKIKEDSKDRVNIAFKDNNPETPRQQLWDMLNAKGLIDKEKKTK